MSVFVKEERDESGCCYDLEMILPVHMGELGGGAGSGPEWLLPGSPLLFQDRMMSGCDTVTGEHSYSSQQEATVGSQESDDTVHQFVLPHIKMEEEDLDSEIFSAVPVATATGQTELRPMEIKEEGPRITSPASESQMPTAAPIGRIMSASAVKRKAPARSSTLSLQSVGSKPSNSTGLDSPVRGVVTQNGLGIHHSCSSTSILEAVTSITCPGPVPTPSSCPPSGPSTMASLRVKLEPGLNCLPPSPPSSVSNDSESDESLYPHATPEGVIGGNHSQHVTASQKCKKSPPSNAISAQLTSQLLSSQMAGSRSGALLLTEEEKRTLIAEGYPVPTRLPLSKAEERSLKKIRRKIKNKISAQESRRKKKEYMDALEKRVEILTAQQREMRSRYERLEQTNRELVEQLRVLQSTLDEGVATEENVEEIINITDIPSEDVSC
ncbi:cyclic AMP-responsive element-binding protein 3-like protein 1 isoform X2 [Varroa jacobsoni]|uniref:BZIP domain-containing protein n=1 Tax=Varroa destructor TaxID=109461 RepID=A0A7M7JN89_VARDE|nr:cyclic AMP-responsive element-binding protein 3-like protein 1 isoform X2 [Varroa destructor]XP_022704843.1 cyclic AMP-responsive element-binding protein 3-like protein 1 isoform X2 [Varroa jacobsoni]